jgi:hypothetical protein
MILATDNSVHFADLAKLKGRLASSGKKKKNILIKNKIKNIYKKKFYLFFIITCEIFYILLK